MNQVVTGGHMRFGSVARTLGLVVLLGAACAPVGAPGGSSAPAPAPEQPSRTLNVTIRVEPTTLASRLGQGGGATLNMTRRLFNANLLLFDASGKPLPYLATQAPTINTDTWKV